jgi:hypothetical protein
VQVEEPNPRGDGRVEVTEVDVTERSGTDDDVIAMCQRERTGDVEQSTTPFPISGPEPKRTELSTMPELMPFP